MTDIAIASTDARDIDAGRALGLQIREKLGGKSADALIVFTSPQNDYEALLRGLKEESKAALIIGCSSAGEFTQETSGTGLASAIGFHAPDMKFNASIGHGLSRDRAEAARSIVSGFTGVDGTGFRYRTAFVLVDALAGHAEELVDQLTLATAGTYRFAGGGAGDDAAFKSTHVFYDTGAFSDAAVALEILSNKPIGIGAQHGWQPASDAMRVTESNQSCMVSLNVAPAVEAFEEYAEATDQKFDRADPMPFFLHNIVGYETDDGHKLRVPLGVADSGGILTAAEVPAGATTHIMSTQARSAAAAAAAATRDAMEQVESAGYKPKAAIFLDCVATRLRLGQEFGKELDAVSHELNDIPFAGFNSYGQIVRADGQFSGFHNCTAVVCVFPE